MSEEKVNLGFSYQASPTGEVRIFRNSTFVTILRKQAATSFLKQLEGLTEAERQQVMARVTGNYKRGNERSAQHHPRNQ
jgi:hypothetical protein